MVEGQATDEKTSHALAFRRGADLGMGKDDQLLGLLIGGVADDRSVADDLLPVMIRGIDNPESGAGAAGHSAARPVGWPGSGLSRSADHKRYTWSRRS